jgi:hypothetical protein
MIKRCPSCEQELPHSAFGRNKSSPDGLSFYCLACNRQRNRTWYRERRQSMGKEVRDYTWIPDGFRWCPTCELAVAHEDYTRNSRTASGFGSQCKPCHRRASSSAYFYRAYKLTKAEVAELRALQQDRCAICGEASPQHLDHDHETGAIRQLLCQRCNHGLGLFRDSPDLLHAAAYYVQLHTARQQVAADLTAARRPLTVDRPGEPPTQQRRPRSSRPQGTGAGGMRNVRLSPSR